MATAVTAKDVGFILLYARRSGRQGFKYILGLSLATDVSRLANVHSQITEITEIERSELRFRNHLLVSLVSRRSGYDHGQDVGIDFTAIP